MFETAVVHAQTQAPERRVGLLSASVGIHTLAGAAIIIATIIGSHGQRNRSRSHGVSILA